ncbi:hypothetical protein PNEG_01254 [Pneumocystis murina B123]|uniref:DNA-directed RNA polymerase III subunit n=1 Tax=Pneumocystis murina (strain B123) TaxID=1069680 RepID=M7NPB0_PNEMU|nr:hypothetical protein PNEG_01254 [Pneumocystis murina B123]EMR10548.1 hypothetical protein PNEG_01254 [Pneumocystis murina B123]
MFFMSSSEGISYINENYIDEKAYVQYYKELHTKISKESPFYISMSKGIDKDVSDYVEKYSDKYKPVPKMTQSLFFLKLEPLFFPEELFDVFLKEYKDAVYKEKVKEPVVLPFLEGFPNIFEEEMRELHECDSDIVEECESRKEDGNDQDEDFDDDDNNDYEDNYFDPGDEDYEDGSFSRDNVGDYF